MRPLLVLAVFALGCTSHTRAPAPVTAAATEPQPPGYLGLGFSYEKPDPRKPGWLMVRHVPDDGPAYRAGLKPQTVITAINGRPLDYPDDAGVLNFFKSLRPGDAVRLTLAGPEAKELVLIADEMPPEKLRIWRANFEDAKPAQ